MENPWPFPPYPNPSRSQKLSGWKTGLDPEVFPVAFHLWLQLSSWAFPIFSHPLDLASLWMRTRSACPEALKTEASGVPRWTHQRNGLWECLWEWNHHPVFISLRAPRKVGPNTWRHSQRGLSKDWRGVPVMAPWWANPTRNREVVGSIPALTQWVKDPALPWAVVSVADTARIPRCCGSGVGWQLWLRFDP